MLVKVVSPRRSAMACVAQKEPAARAETVMASNDATTPHWLMSGPPLSMIKAIEDSLRTSNSLSTASRRCTSSSINDGSPGIALFLSRRFVDELVQQHSRNHVQRLKYSRAFGGHCGKGWHLYLAVVQQKLHILDGRDVGQIALVVLNDIWNIGNIEFE